MKLYSLVILLVLTFAVQKSRTEEMNSIKLEKRPFQIYPVDIAANAKVLQVYVFFFYEIWFIWFSSDIQTNANIQVLGKLVNEKTSQNETDCKDLFSRVVIMEIKTVRLENENAKLKLENLHLQQKVTLDMFHKLKH